MNYKNIFLFAFLFPFFIKAGGSPKFKVKEIEYEIVESDNKDVALFNSDEIQEQENPFTSILNLEDSFEEESPSSPIVNLTKSHKDWVKRVYEQQDKNLSSLLGCCAALCVESSDELSLRVMFKNLKVFFLNFDDENEDIYDLFCKYVNEEKFINNPTATLFGFLWQYQLKLNKTYTLYDIRLNKIVFAFAEFIKQDEENLFKPGLEFFIKQCAESFDPQYLSKYINKIFVADICINHKIFKNFDSLSNLYLKFFICLGVDFNHCGHSDKISSSIATAVKYDYIRLAEFLLKNGVDTNFKCKNRSCKVDPLSHYLYSIEMMKLLAQNKVAFDETDQYGQSALYPLVKKIYEQNILNAKDTTEFKQMLSEHQQIIINLLNEKAEADESLVRRAQDLLLNLEDSEKVREYKQIISEEFSPNKMQNLISLFKKN